MHGGCLIVLLVALMYYVCDMPTSLVGHYVSPVKYAAVIECVCVCV